MASIYDLIKRYTYGMPGQDGGQATRGLLGTGGEYGGGLLQDIVQSPDVISGLGLFSSGMRGESVQDALIKQAKIKQLLQPQGQLIRAKNKQTGQNVFVTKQQVLSNPNVYEPLVSTTQPTLSGEAFIVYNKLKGAKNKEEFQKAYDALSPVEQDIYNSKIKAAYNPFDIGAIMGNQTFESKVPKKEEKKINIQETDDFKITKKANPKATDQQIIDFLKNKFPDKYK